MDFSSSFFDDFGPNPQPAGYLIDNLAVQVLEVKALGDQPSDGLAPAPNSRPIVMTGIYRN